MKEWFSAKELAGLPGMPVTVSGVIRVAKRENWRSRKRQGRGGGREYHLNSLPPETQSHLGARRLMDLATDLPLPGPKPFDPLVHLAADGDLTDRQRRERDARAQVLAAVERMRMEAECTRKEALTALLTTARAGEAPAELIAALKVAKDPRGRRSDNPFPSVRTLKRWLGQADLAPKVPQKDMTLPPWAEAFLECYRRPEKPSVAAAYRQACAVWPPGQRPSIHQVRRLLKKLGTAARESGRRGPVELKAVLPFVRRGFEDLLPNDIWSADGHTFDAEVQHPLHGRPFRPEITSVIDIRTRRVVGWSVALAESAQAVADALRRGIEVCGVPVWWYVDNGSGYKNQMIADPATGICGRLGIQITHSLPYNSQARGVIERLHQTLWVTAAKDLPGFVGKEMDRQARLERFKISRKALKQGGAMPLIPWETFLDFCRERVDAYNASPHRSLGGLSPDEAWTRHVEHGWRQQTIPDEVLTTLFRPRVTRALRRCEVQLFGNLYFNLDLVELHGMEVQVAYDIHDPNTVWVYDQDGRYIADMAWNGNRQTYLPVSAEDREKQKRALGRLQRLDSKKQEVLEELKGQPVIDLEAMRARPMIGGRPLEIGKQASEKADKQPKKPRCRSEMKPEEVMAEWDAIDARIRGGETVSEADARWHEMFQGHPIWKAEMKRRGKPLDFNEAAC